jgi:hypothetical protein
MTDDEMTKDQLTTKGELVKKLGLSSPDQLTDLLTKFRDRFLKHLDDEQLKVVKRSLPTLCEASAWLGPCATLEDLRKLFGGDGRDVDSPPIMVCHFATTERPGT